VLEIILSVLPWTGFLLAAVALIQTGRASRLKSALKEAEDGQKLALTRLAESVRKQVELDAANRKAQAQARETAARLAEAQAAGLEVMNEAAAEAAAIMRGEK
jgi:hypothetical protein